MSTAMDVSALTSSHLAHSLPPPSLSSMLQERERELNELRAVQQKQTESAVQTLTQQLSTLQQKYDRLKTDFAHNLRVVAERDSEIQESDAWFEKCKKLLADRDAEISDLKTSLANQSSGNAQMKQELQALQWQHLADERQRKNDLERSKAEHEEQMERMRRDMMLKFEQESAIRESAHQAYEKSAIEARQAASESLRLKSARVAELEQLVAECNRTMQSQSEEMHRLSESARQLTIERDRFSILAADSQRQAATDMQSRRLQAESEFAAAKQALQSELSDKEQRLQTAEFALSKATNDINSLQLRLQRFESGTEQHTLSIQHSLQAERESFEQARTEWEATQQMLRADVLNRDRQIIELRQQVQVAHQNTENAKLEIETLKLESQAADQRAELANQAASEHSAQVRKLLDDKHALLQQQSELQHQLNTAQQLALQPQSTTASSEYDSLMFNLRSQVSDLQAQLLRSSQNTQSAQSDLLRATESRRAMETELQRCEAERHRFESENHQLMLEIQHLQQSQQELRHRLSDWEDGPDTRETGTVMSQQSSQRDLHRTPNRRSEQIESQSMNESITQPINFIPAFADDMGPASPVPSIQNMLSPQHKYGNAVADHTAEHIRTNQNHSDESVGNQSDIDPSSRVSVEEQRFQHMLQQTSSESVLQRRVSELEQQNSNLRDHNSTLQQQVNELNRNAIPQYSDNEQIVAFQSTEVVRLQQKCQREKEMVDILQQRIKWLESNQPESMLALRNSVAEENEHLRTVLAEQNQHIESLLHTIAQFQNENVAYRDEIAAKLSQLRELEQLLPKAGTSSAPSIESGASHPTSSVSNGVVATSDPPESVTMMQLVLRDQECVQLRQKLIQSHSENRRLKTERDKLMEISNMLRAQLSSLQTNLNAPTTLSSKPERMPSEYREIIAREKETTRQLQFNIGKLENALRHLMVQNKKLSMQQPVAPSKPDDWAPPRYELPFHDYDSLLQSLRVAKSDEADRHVSFDEMPSHDTASVASADAARKMDVRQVTNQIARQLDELIPYSSQYEQREQRQDTRRPETHRSENQAQSTSPHVSSLPSQPIVPQWSAPLDSSRQAASLLHANQARAKGLYNNLQQAPPPLPLLPTETHGHEGDVLSERAQNRLKLVEETLQLSGQTVSATQRAVPITASERTTQSQRDAAERMKLKEKPRVRNYNVRSPGSPKPHQSSLSSKQSASELPQLHIQPLHTAQPVFTFDEHNNKVPVREAAPPIPNFLPHAM